MLYELHLRAGQFQQIPMVQVHRIGPDGAAVVAQAAWFARAMGSEVLVYHAVVLSPKPQPVTADTFFAGLELK